MHRLSDLVWLGGLPSLLVLVTWRTVSCPYTKVEESFTIQAVHDIVSYGVRPAALARYDHRVFPGAVPRSFIGPLLLAAISYPFLLLSRFLGAVQTSADAQVVVRLCLASANVSAVNFFCQQTFKSTMPPAKQNSFSRLRDEQLVALLFMLVTAIQFHFAFWASRTIPNSLTLPLVTTALALVCRNVGVLYQGKDRALVDAKVAIWLLTFSGVVLRLEIVATLVPVGLYLLVTRRISFWAGLKTGIVSGTFSILLTTVIDTYFWQDLAHANVKSLLSIYALSLRNLTSGDRPKPLWPELHALLFNVVQGKSSEWGVSPWHAYITSLIPRLLAFTGPLVVIGAAQLLRGRNSALEARARFLFLTAVMHIAVLSLLGHKEWRFAFYTLPALNVVASIGASKLARSWPGRAVLAILLLLQLGLSWFTGYVSSINYPGGNALRTLHQHIDADLQREPNGQVIVHIDVLPAMTGVTLFQSIHLNRIFQQSRLDSFRKVSPAPCGTQECWVYDKTENLPVSGHEATQAWSTFTHLITETPECAMLQDQQGRALNESEQLFEQIAPPITSFVGLRRKSFSQLTTDLLNTPLAAASILGLTSSSSQHSAGSLLRSALPVVVVEQPTVWLCRRKHDLTRSNKPTI